MQEERLGQLLGTEEVAEYLGVGPVTVYRWCREGSLPCVKIGRRWRIRREALEEFVRKSERSETLTGRLRAFIEVPDNVLAITQDREMMTRLDAAFFRVWEARGGTLVKYQLEDERMPSLEEVRTEMADAGLEVDRLEDEGRLRLVREGGGGPEERAKEVRRLVAEAPEGGRALWANFNWDLRTGVDEALEYQRLLTGLVEDSALAVKTAILEEDLDEWPGEIQRRAQVVHSGTVWLSREGLAMSRVTPPPAL
jgi:excisionase family DNA binding protein